MNDKYPKITGNTPEESLAVLLRSVQSKDARIGQLEAQVKALGGDPYHGLFQTVSDAPLTLSASTEWIMHPPSEKARAWLGLPPDAPAPSRLTPDMVKEAVALMNSRSLPEDYTGTLRDPKTGLTVCIDDGNVVSVGKAPGPDEIVEAAKDFLERFAPPRSEDGDE